MGAVPSRRLLSAAGTVSSAGTMRCSVRHCLLTLVALGLLWLFITLKVSSEMEDDPVVSIKGQVATVALRVGTEAIGGQVWAGRPAAVPAPLTREQKAPKGVGVDLDPLVHEGAASLPQMLRRERLKTLLELWALRPTVRRPESVLGSPGERGPLPPSPGEVSGSS